MTGKTLSGKYEIKREVGRGGMGVIYEALHSALNRTVAIKVLHPQFTRDIGFLDRFKREARAMARLDHKNIIRVFDVLEDEGTHFIIMEYFEGQNLSQILIKKKKLAQRAVLSIAYQVAKALSYAHEKGVIHRDIKPANIIINKSGTAKIADFGIAATTDEISLTAANHIIGTPEYMSLEQSRGEQLDGRSDLYSLGMVIYEMLTGQTYYAGIAGADVLKKLAYDESELNLSFTNTVVPSLQNLVRNLLKKNKADRIADTSVLIQQIKTSKLELKREKPITEKKQINTKKPISPKQSPSAENREPPPFFSKSAVKTFKPEEQATIIAPKQVNLPPTQRQKINSKWPKRMAAFTITALIFAGIAYPFFKNKLRNPRADTQITQLQTSIKTLQERLAQTHLASGPDEIRPWAEKAYNKAAKLEEKALTHLKEAQHFIKMQSDDDAKNALKNAHFLFSQAHEGFLRAKETAHGKIVQEAEFLTEKEKRAQSTTTKKLAQIKKEREKVKKERKRQEALLRSELIKLSKEKKQTKKERRTLEKAQRERKNLQKKITTKNKKSQTKQKAPTKIAAVSPTNTLDSLGGILSRLTAAYEKKDLRALQKMSAMSKNRAIFLKQIFKNYKSVTVSVTGLSIEDEQAEATISITELRTHKNKKALPPDHWKDVKLIIPKNKGQWDKIRW